MCIFVTKPSCVTPQTLGLRLYRRVNAAKEAAGLDVKPLQDYF